MLDAVFLYLNTLSGAQAVLLFCLLFYGLSLLCLPASLLTAAAGFFFGFALGGLLVLLCTMAASQTAFELGRGLLFRFVRRRLTGHVSLQNIEAALLRQGKKTVLWLRLASVFPFIPLSYALGSTPLQRRDFFLPSLLGLAPSAALYVYLGSMLADIRALTDGHSLQEHIPPFVYALALLLLLAAMIYCVKTARHALREVTDKNDPSTYR